MRKDPLPAFNFYITFVDTSNTLGTLFTAAFDYWVAGFTECTGLDASIEIYDYKEGGVNGYVHKFAGRASHPNIVLKHGVIMRYDDLWKWHQDWITGRGKRKDGRIILQNEARKPAKIWRFKRGIPMKWTGPQLNASASNVAIEALEIAHEGLEMETGV